MSRSRNRREALRLAGSTLTVGMSGCSGLGFFGFREPFDPHEHVDDWQDDYVRGAADPIETGRSVDSPGSLKSLCGWVASDAVETAITEQVTITRAVDIGYTKAEGINDGEWFVMVNRIIHFDRSNEVHLTPVISFSALREVTPHTVNATITRNGQEYSCRHPVYLVDYAEQVAP